LRDDIHTTQRTILSNGPEEPGPHSACVVVIHGEGLGKRVDIGATPMMVGRSHEADLQIQHASISRKHCTIWRVADGYRVRDLGSTNKTRVNERVVEEAPLGDGDHITIGETILKFISHSSVEARYHEEVYQLATHDALSELYNRRHFIELLDKEIARSLRHDRPLAMLIVDLDHFKAINDVHGHIAGDVVLRQFSEILRRMVRADDIAARIGGEEFAVVLPETGERAAHEFAERLRQAVATAQFAPAGVITRITVSIGLSMLGESTSERSTLMRSADRALYRAKDEGRNRTCVA
jgi:diguanylate cyclase (GGDEF)-like protein